MAIATKVQAYVSSRIAEEIDAIGFVWEKQMGVPMSRSAVAKRLIEIGLERARARRAP
jgi:hypothetical protein